MDMGCGYGFFTNLLDSMGYEVCGVDLDPERIAEATKAYRSSFVLADSRHPPFRGGSFDLVFCRALSTFYVDLQRKPPSEQRDTLMELLRTDGLFLYETASTLSGRYGKIQNHKIGDVKAFFGERTQGCEVYFLFAPTVVLRVLGRYAFSGMITRLSAMLTTITGRSGYIICGIKTSLGH